MAGFRGPDEPKVRDLGPTLVKGMGEAAKPQAEPPIVVDELINKTIMSRYKILELIGQGGMGNVYLAEDTRLGKRVAVKVLPQFFEKMPNIAERFMQEALLAPRIDHENIIDVTDRGKTSKGVPFFVMEYLKGNDLAGTISREGPMPWCERTKDMLLQICRGLGAAHEKGVVHRDMKPENVFLVERSDGSTFIKLFDFGIAKLIEETALEKKRSEQGNPADAQRKAESEAPVPSERAGMTLPGTVMGTPQYMAPEQASGGDVDHRADVYAVGTIMYEMLCGRVPFVLEAKESPMADAFRILEMQKTLSPTPPHTLRPDLPILPAVEAVILRALAKKPVERFQSMKEMEEAIGAIPAPDVIPLTERPEAHIKDLRPGSRAMLGYSAIEKEEAKRRRRVLRIAAIAAAAAIAGASAGGTVHSCLSGSGNAPADAGVGKYVDTKVSQPGKR